MPDFSLENAIKGDICGLDEVGRGPLAGPVVAACVFIPDQSLAFIKDIDDSKKLSLKKRDALYTHITDHCPYGIGQCSVEEIDKINILQASLLAMTRAYESMGYICAHALIDGNQTPKALPCASTHVIKGDSVSVSIAAASIIAKVTRDNMMKDLDRTYPHYGWKSNAGYGSQKHVQALKEYGITPHHRKSFAPVRHMLEKTSITL